MDNRKSVLEQNRLDELVVKCACGLTMRQKNWADHWRTCRVGSPMPVQEYDREALLASEERKRKAAEEHEQWLRDRQKVDAARSNGRVS
jgi:hypothetical protein